VLASEQRDGERERHTERKVSFGRGGEERSAGEIGGKGGRRKGTNEKLPSVSTGVQSNRES
jgi:hypothetical protein